MARSANEMTFLEHLEAMRWHLLRSVVAIAIVACVAFVFKELLFDHVLFALESPSFATYALLCKVSPYLGMGDQLCITPVTINKQSIVVMGQFMMAIKASLLAGLIVASPYVFWEIWRFLKPAMYDKELRYAKGLVAICVGLFLTGISFGYFIIAPFSINFLGAFSVSDQVTNQFTLNSYVNMIMMICMASGIIFELPVFAYFLSKIGILTPQFMRKYRKHALIVVLVLSAIITPPDVLSQIIISIPIVILYEISIGISRRAQPSDD